MENLFNFSELESVVFGKGPTFCNPIKEDNQIHVCVNDSINEISEPDVLVFNDFETYKKLNPEKIKKVKVIVTPYFLHYEGLKKRFLWSDLKNLMDYKNIWFPYNLKTSPPVYGYPNFDSALTSSNTAVEWLVLMGVKKIKTYGIGTKSGYSNLFVRTEGSYNVDHIRQEITSRCNLNGVELQML